MASGALIDYLGQGPIAARPASPTLATGVLGLWYATDTGALSAWNGSAWATISAGSGGSIGQLNGINDQTGTAYTLVLSDAGKDVRCTNAAAVALTIPPNSAVAFPVGTWLLFSQGGAGAVTATAGAGVTLNAANGKATTAQYDIRGLEKVGTDTWRAI
jgi:hypothetical protein